MVSSGRPLERVTRSTSPALTRSSGPRYRPVVCPGGHHLSAEIDRDRCRGQRSLDHPRPGYGTKLIIDRFGAASVDAVDLDPKMLVHAQQRLARYGPAVRLAQGSATDLFGAFSPFGGGMGASYDAVFDFAIIHHVPDWQAAVAEVARVLNQARRAVFSSTRSPPPRWPDPATACCSTIPPRTVLPQVISSRH